jgi:hypothetical protein
LWVDGRGIVLAARAPGELLEQSMAKYQVIEDFGPLGQPGAGEIFCLWILI